MTREQKLALILGFALVLIVGVLLSDHLSGASKARVDDVVAFDPTASSSEVPDHQPVAINNPSSVPTITGGDGGTQILVSPNDTAPAGQPLTPPGSRIERFVDGAGDEIGGAIDDLMNGRTPPKAVVIDPARTQPEETEMGGQEQSGNQGEESVEPTPAGGGEEQLEDVRPAAKADKPGKTHRVEEGETLWGIAKRYYGDGSLHAKLAQANKERLTKDGSVRAGTTLNIPSKESLTGKPAKTTETKVADAKPEPGTSKPKDAPATTTKKNASGTYTVQKGDTLGEISQKELGTAGRWEEILDLNRDKLDDESSLQVGMVLKMPKR